jgi:flagellar basal-body rod protein FlgB
MWDKLFASTDLLQKGLEASWLRNAVLRNNIANAETPNFKTSDVEFESVLARSLEGGSFAGKRTNVKHIEIGAARLSSVTPRVVENDDTSMRMDGNNVDAEAENVKLAQNTIQYNTLIYKLNSELSRIKMAVREGK